ncbi:MAG TPA: YkgJ family cysteine cluster protein [Myxococcales bacterium LLY-WYZ-16_1]|nr:YkgJ family cysteine cluster protein [Myxococcales bacterium LLY-WYZ-16_1]
MPERKIVPSAYTPRTDASGVPERKVLPYRPMVDPCKICPGRCCHLNVKVSLPEALRYTGTYQLPFFAGLALVPSSHERRAFQLDRDPRLVAAHDGWMGTAELQLRRQESGACHALIDAGGFKRCGIYPVRPSLCRLYPFSWESEDAKGGPEMVLCPTPYAITPSAESQFLTDVEDGLAAWRLHEEVVAAWNGRETDDWSVEAFLAFTLPRVGEAIGIDPEPVLAAGTADEQLTDAMIRAETLRVPGASRGAPPENPPSPRGVAGLSAPQVRVPRLNVVSDEGDPAEPGAQDWGRT